MSEHAHRARTGALGTSREARGKGMDLPNLEGKLIGVVLAHSPVNQVGMVVLE